MRQWVLSVPFPLRFLLASQPVVMNRVLRIVYRTISSFLIKKAKFKKKTAKTGAVTFIQRFGSALNLNVHFHMLFLDGVYINDKNGLRFIPVFEPQKAELIKLIHKIALRIGRYLERAGYVERDAENSFLTEAALAANEISEHQSHSVQYRIAMGPQKGKKVFSLQTMVPILATGKDESVAMLSGFSLHAGVSIKANQRDKLEKICRYISRPAISTHRLSLTPQGKIRYELKTPYRNGTTHVIEKRVAMNWARRLKRAFQIDIEKCEACGGKVKIIACIEDSMVINKILSHLNHSAMNDQLMLRLNRAPPLSSTSNANKFFDA